MTVRRPCLLQRLSLVAIVASSLVACGDDPAATVDTQDTTTVDTDARDVPDSAAEINAPDAPPTGEFATVVFTIDDSANKTYTTADGLAWKGTFSCDAATNVCNFNGSWDGPFAMLRDDGLGGDESADDGIWTAAVRVPTPAADLAFQYGAVRDSVDGSDGAWIWKGSDGTFAIPANTTGTIVVPGLVISPFGDIDLRLTLDLSNRAANLHLNYAGVDYTEVMVKGGIWSWREIPMRDDGQDGDAVAGDGIHTFVYSKNLGAHDGLLREGDDAPFVFVLDKTEYKADVGPPTDGVTAAIDSGAGFVPVPIQKFEDGDRNTYVVATVTSPPFEPPAGHTAVNFVIDDTANKTYDATDGLAWKGSFDHDAITRTVAFSQNWTGPYPMLFDNGPWDQGGHEPVGSIAGDNRWGVTVWVDHTTTQTFSYGAIRGSSGGSDGAWIWSGEDGSFTATAGSATAITAQGLTIAPHGTTDLKLTIDVSNSGANLATLFQGGDFADGVEVKGNAWAWSVLDLVDDGSGGDDMADDGIYTFTLSAAKGKHDGLLKAGDTAEFVFVLAGEDYRDNGAATTLGIKAYTKTTAGFWTEATVFTSGQNNTAITAP